MSESTGLQDLEHLHQRKAQLAAERLKLLQSIQQMQQKIQETEREEEYIVHQLHGKNEANMQPTDQQEDQPVQPPPLEPTNLVPPLIEAEDEREMHPDQSLYGLAIAGMAYAAADAQGAQGNPVELWHTTVNNAWAEAFPYDPMPEQGLDVQGKEDVHKVVALVEFMVPNIAEASFDVRALRHFLASRGGELFADRNFLNLNFSFENTRHLTLSNGLLHVMARAIGVRDYRDIIEQGNVEKWYEAKTRSYGGRKRARSE